MKQTPSRTRNLVKQIIQRIKPYDPEKVYLIGSWARGEADDISDIDLVIIKTTDRDFFERMREASRIMALHRAADVFVYTPEEFERMKQDGNAFILTVLEEGALIYDKAETGGLRPVQGFPPRTPV